MERGDDPRPAAEHPAPIRRVLVFSIVSLALMTVSIDATIVSTALHALQLGLGASINWTGWTLTAYSLGFVVMLPISGKLGERYGLRRTFLGSVATFTVASLCCGLANDIYLLIALRALQAAGGAGFTPSATGIIVEYFGAVRDRAVSLFGSIFSVGAMIGPVFGGLFVTYSSWRGVFFVNVPIGVAVIALTLRYVPRDRPRQAHTRPGMDAVGIALLGTGILVGMLAVSYLGERGARVLTAAFLVPAAVAVAALVRFFYHINHAENPFIAPRLVHGPGFGPINLVNTLYGGIPLAVVALIPLYAANRYGIDALDAGTLLIAQGLAALALSMAVTFALRRIGYRLPLYVGCVIIAAGTVLLALTPVGGISPYLWLAGATFGVGVGTGIINPPCRNAGLQLAPESSATVAALRSMGLQIGSIVTVSVATAILTGSRDPGIAQAWIYGATALLFAVALPLIARVPEHHGSW